MKFACLALLLLALIPEGQSAKGDVGEDCNTGDVCTQSAAFCQASDKKCRCNVGWIADGAICKEGLNQICGNSQCYPNLVCSNGNCVCDQETVGFLDRGTDGTTICTCPTGKAVRKSDGKCALVIGQTCKANSDCIDNALCTGSKCTCDTSKFFDVGTVGDTKCTCDPKAAGTDTCKLKLTKGTCASDSDCVAGTGVKCISGTCGCDSSLNLAPNAANTACECGTDYLKQDGVCKLKLTKGTCASDSDCVAGTGVKCNSGTCGCDSSLNLVLNAVNTACECRTGYLIQEGVCKVKLDSKTCTSATDCVKATDVKCNAGTCECDASKNRVATVDKLLCDCKVKYAEKVDKTCGAIVDETCAQDADCMDNAKCLSTKCACDATKKFAGTSGATSCSCTTNYALNPDKLSCGLKIGQKTCTTATDCVGGPGAMCSTDICACDTSKNFKPKADNTGCECDTAKSVDKKGICILKIGQKTCTTATDCVDGPGAMCSSGTCACDTSKNFKPKADNTGCECDTAKSVDEKSICKLKLGQTTCTADSDCVTVPGKMCNAGTCGCDASKHLTPNSGKTACECTADYTMEGTTCVLKVGKACSSSTPCVHGSICDKKTNTCLCDVSHNFKAGSLGDTSCFCDSKAVSVTIDLKKYCVGKIGGACKETSNVCGRGLKCDRNSSSANAFYQCQCESGTPNADGTCNSAENIAVLLVLLMVGLMTAALL